MKQLIREIKKEDYVEVKKHNESEKLILKALRIIIEKLTNKGEEYPEVCQEIEEILNPKQSTILSEKTLKTHLVRGKVNNVKKF